MNKRQKEVQQQILNREKAVLSQLERNYRTALNDINQKIEQLLSRQDADMQHVIYQVEYQKALRSEVQGILARLQANEFTTISAYLTVAYEDRFVGTMYDLHGQGVPVISEIDERQVVEAVQHETPLSQNLYTSLGKDVKEMQKQIAAEISRGVATALPYADIARNIAAHARISKNKAMRIARTEAHRIQNKAAFDAQHKASDAGASVVKQWDAALDSRTRKSHRKLDGQIRELDEPFEVDGKKAMYPGGFGRPEEDIHCRCALLQRARWALDDDELQTLKDRAAYYGLDKTKSFDDFRKKYLKAVEGSGKSSKIEVPKRYKNATSDKLEAMGVTYNQVEARKAAITFEEIVDKLGGGDKTSGSCASVGLAYIGQKHGYDVLDFRGGDSMKFFSSKLNKVELFKNLGVKSIVEDSFKSNISNGKKILSRMEVGKEYYLSVGRHAAIVRMTEDGFQYLELQSPSNNGWKNFSKDVKETLKWRFGCISSTRYYPTAYLTDIEQLKGNNEFVDVLGYINTSTNGQKKGVSGNVK